MEFRQNVSNLPLELAQILTQTYFLHLLATEPDTVIPHGKSLLSMMVRSPLKPAEPEPVVVLHDRVKTAIHSAFWQQALEALSDPTPAVQIDRLKGLLFDVREAIFPLFPKNDEILATLSAPVPPTASPLISTSLLLKEILVALRRRAAPVRDPTIDGLLADLDAPLSPIAASPSSSIKSATSQLALLVVNTMKSIISLAETMKADLNQFVLGSMTETQLKDVVVQQAKKREKELVLDIWGDSGKDGRERVQAHWQSWIDELEGEQPSQPRDKWIRRLVQSLSSTKPVSCTIPEPVSPEEPVQDGNQLPPQFFFTTPRLLYAQNYLQALVVAASLRSLTRLPASLQSDPPNDSRGHDFMDRIWTLLKAEIDEEDPSASTKIINFADEVVRARRLVSVPDEQEEAQLRAAVDRTLQYGDAVFLLLQKRLMTAVAHRLCELTVDVAVNHAPERMQTGRTLGAGRADKRPRLDTEAASSVPAATPVKGFEEPILIRGIEDILTRLRHHIGWIETVWIDSS
ncbi:hypothetical protein C8F04DRAFT_1206455 [Mycena alexandri]|uniref:Uncharacterized protein n=1 Tax=Mycena alexandri TaxID=1745969 RepID=A0AAD6TFF4_9AGAR|nr:hypothetical protein C8F04DRAFT_1206455 [Mycena alexandri]